MDIFKLFLKQNINTVLLAAGLILLVWFFMLPAPFSLGYLCKRIFYKETGLCRDGTYTFAYIPQGACSSHGGVKDWYKRDY